MPTSALWALLPLCLSSAEAASQKGERGSVAIEASPEAFPAARELSEKIAEIEAGGQNVRARLLGLQDSLAARFRDVVELSVEAQTRNEDAKRPPLGFVELEAFLNDVPLVSYTHPPVTGRDAAYPLYAGPIPVGGYDLKVRAIVGIMLHGWPHAYLQGRWSLEKTFRISVTKNHTAQKYRIEVKPGDTEPSLTLAEGAR